MTASIYQPLSSRSKADVLDTEKKQNDMFACWIWVWWSGSTIGFGQEFYIQFLQGLQGTGSPKLIVAMDML